MPPHVPSSLSTPRRSGRLSRISSNGRRRCVPLLEKNAVESEKQRRAVEENIRAITDAGLFRLMVPRRCGGFQGTLKSHLEVSAALAEGCGGTAWVVALTNVCAWFTGLFAKQAQDEVFGADPDARSRGSLRPRSNPGGWMGASRSRESGTPPPGSCMPPGEWWGWPSVTRMARWWGNTSR